MAEELLQIKIRPNNARASTQYPDFGDVRCGLAIRYSGYDSRFYLWILDLDGTRIAGPIKLVPGIDLLLPYKYDPRVPQGELFCYSADRQPPTLDTADTDAVLYYRAP